jgi:post-segregation antitoxin (ccd killing protein)
VNKDKEINPSQAGERDLAAAVADARRARWLETIRDAMEAWYDCVSERGLPLALIGNSDAAP